MIPRWGLLSRAGGDSTTVTTASSGNAWVRPPYIRTPVVTK